MTHAAQVRKYVQDHLTELLEDLRRLVHTETPSNRKDLLQIGLAEIEDYVTTRLGEPSARRQHEGGPRGDVLDLTWPGSPGVEGSVLSVCHYDTVWPEGTVEDWPLTQQGDELSGPGVLDMKAGIVQTVWMLLALRQLKIPHPALRLMLTGDEEIGSLASRRHIEAAARESQVTLIAEPSAGGDVKVQRKGTVTADIVVHGIESHAGLDPEKGASAIHEMARLIPSVLALADPDLATTVNVGLLAGGSGRNVVAGLASCQIDIRIQEPQEEDRVVGVLEALAPHDDRCRLEIMIDRNRPPMNPTEQTERLLGLVKRAGRDLGEVVGTQAVGGASDGNYIAALGLPVIDGLGGIGDGPHARHEHIQVSGLPRQVALMAGLVELLADGH
ncbi:M20/M25/M40 family metallo-hydrolase [Ornithinimicrobium pratense]|uniref:M20 family metallopeptidase n=1 Tax=Ornithinimicrobium pratense TaxID=2593973 RepID=A0A5J6V535_9MICO|nr:M20/M25/M40 family metallo-hydrolase [Ornithinimicrobium pratense]QFG68414.1 M20 family metallopeptidase [Ornithinimicrobium pratense]